jgi:hypothetical protein
MSNMTQAEFEYVSFLILPVVYQIYQNKEHKHA